MTVKLNLDGLDPDVPVPTGEPEAHVHESSLYDGITGQVVVGRYVLQIGEAFGAVVSEASQLERPHIRPRSTPILLRPSLIRGLVGRQTEVAAVLSALDTGLPVEIRGEPGIGKTAILRHLAHHPRAASFADGVVYLPARHQSSGDLVQRVFEAFYETDEITKPTDAEIRRSLQDKQALILLDGVQLSQHGLEHVLDVAPRSAFVLTVRERCLWGEVRSLLLKGLSGDDAVSLLEREIERALDLRERPAAVRLCAALGGHPFRILQAAAIIRERGVSLDWCVQHLLPATLVPELLSSIDDKQRRALLALAVLPGVPLSAQHVSGIAELLDIESSLMALVRRGLVVSGQSRHRLADRVADQLRRTDDLNPWVNRAITYFTAWAERQRRTPGSLLQESDALLRVQQWAVEARRHGEVLRLGRLLEGALIAGARWGAWAINLERCLAAAKATGDRSAEAWALHQIGTRALCSGEPGMARVSLSQAVKLRQALNDDAATAASTRNLAYVLTPAPESVSELDLDALPLRDEATLDVRIPRTSRAGTVAIGALLFVIAAGFAFVVTERWWPRNAGGSSSLPRSGSAPAPAIATTGQIQAAHEPRVLQFSAAPDRIAPGEPVRLCYEVANGAHVRIEPDIGEVAAQRSDCVSATPRETTTYMLTAHGEGGASARQKVLVLVGVPASPPSPPEASPDVRSPRQQERPADDPAPAPLPPEPVSDRASILLFSPRPGSILGAEPTRLCYAVSGALRARVEPDIGDVNPKNTLTCLPVAPARTTTYELTAYGRDSHPVKQQLVVIVR